VQSQQCIPNADCVVLRVANLEAVPSEAISNVKVETNLQVESLLSLSAFNAQYRCSCQ
jgi:hypothetical protein